MKKNFCIVFTYACMLVLSAGCLHDKEVAGGDAGPVGISTRAVIGGTLDGITVGRVRMIATDVGGRVVFNRYLDAGGGDLILEEGDPGGGRVGNFKVTLRPGTYDFVAVVNELDAQSAALGAISTMADLEAVTLSATQLTGLDSEAALVCVGHVRNVMVRAGTAEGDAAQVSTDGGGSWSATLDMPVTRAAVKLTVKVGNFNPAGDTFTVTDAALGAVPSHAWLLPRIYNGGLADRVAIWDGSVAVDPSPVSDPVWREVVVGYLMPEYLMADPADRNAAPTLTLTADYTTSAGTLYGGIEYEMTLLGGTDEHGETISNFDMPRGTHYQVWVAVSDMGGFDHYLAFTVDKWQKVTDNPTDIDIGGVFAYNAEWASGTILENGGAKARVNVNSSVTLEFSMTAPAGGVWTAQLTNTEDFYFDELVGVRRGTTRAEHYRIVVRPRGDKPRDAVATEIYVTASNGVRNVELDLTGNGPGNRFVIEQIPSL